MKWVVIGGLFIIPFLPMYVANSMFFPFITGKNFAFRIIVEIIFGAWIVLALYEPQYRPRFSYILVTFIGLLAVMFVADAHGIYPPKSFWSNFERMDGYITLVHVFLYTFVLASVGTSEKFWKYFLHTALAVSLFVAASGLIQFLNGTIARVDAQLGNAAYMAIYMLFNLFIAAYLALKTNNRVLQIFYGLFVILLAYVLILTWTRGTFLGMIGGAVVTIAYVAFFGRVYPQLRRLAVFATIGFVILASLFVMFRQSPVIQHVDAFKRIANINFTSDLKVRETIWHMAWEGVKERPILGWGQGNFNYVFNKYYDPFMWNQEQWFDRAHDIFFDWLITGGILGLIAYFSVLGAAAWYLVVEPVFLKRESNFTVLERAVLFGLLSGYLIHNVVVFDNIISYIFYGTILALIHSRVSRPIKRVASFQIDPIMVTQFAFPVVFLITGFLVYAVNIPGIMASNDIIVALTAPSVQGRLDGFKQALREHSVLESAIGWPAFSRQEVVEQLAQQAMNIAVDQRISAKQKQPLLQLAEQELLAFNAQKPHDARIESFVASFYRSIGALDEARKYEAMAVADSPQKPALIMDQGIIEIEAGKMNAAIAFFKKAFELETANTRARVLYAAVLFSDGQAAKAKQLIGDQYLTDFATNNYALSVVKQSGDFPYLAKLFQARVAKDPTSAQDWATLSFIYYQMHEATTAVAVLQQAGQNVPAFAPLATCYAKNIQNGKTPDAGCTASSTSSTTGN